MGKSRNKIKWQVVLTLFLMTVTISHSFGQQSSSEEKIPSIKVSLQIADNKFCRNKTVAYSGNGMKSTINVGELQLYLKLKITNTDTQPVILDKTSFQVSKRIISELNAKNDEEKLISNTYFYLHPTFNKLEMDTPNKEKFVILKPEEVYSYEFRDVAQLKVEDSEKLMNGVFLKYTATIWGGQTGLDKKFKEKWKDFGYLWTHSIVTDSVLLKIERQKKISNCY